ncbi:MAG: DUF5668 domain-containing protein [Acidobacteriota bacterium]|jgi:hypothetical protein
MSVGSRKGALVFGLILIAIGLVFFLPNWYPNQSSWQLAARYWPVLLILIGARKLYGYATWQQEQAADETARRRHRQPSLMAGLLWTAFGIMFLLRNFGIGPDLWAMARRYWPILLILVGLGKVIDYLRQKEGVSLKVGEVFSLLFVLIIGLAISQIPGSAVKDMLSSSINIGGTDVFLGTTHEYTQEFTYPLNSETPVRIENSNGQVSVSPGSDNEIRVHLRKSVFEDDEARARQIADEIKVEGGQEGQAKALTFVLKTNRDGLSSRNYHFKTDMDVFVPKRVQLELRNSFGGVNVSGLDGKINVQSSTGSSQQGTLEVHDCSGSFVVSNEYIEARLTSLTGNLSVTARGRVTVQGVKGDVDVHNEYSPVEISDIDGKVTVSDDEGSVNMKNVSKSVAIDARGSNVTVNNLQDSVRIISSHRRVYVSDVAADVQLTSSYGSVTLKKIKGNVDITSDTDRLSLEDIGGYLKAAAQESSLHVNNAGGPVIINTSMKDVIVNNFNKGCTVTNDNGDVTLSTDSLSKDQIGVKSRNGDITMFLPPGAAFQLDATAHNGHITSEFAGLDKTTEMGDMATIKGRLKTGGPKIVLESENKDIYVRCRENDQAGTKGR